MGDEGARNLARLTDDELRRELFHRLVSRLWAERDKHPPIVFESRTPYVVRVSRHGHLLRIDQGHDGQLMRIELTWPHRPAMDEQDEPWSASVCRSTDRTRLMLSGGPEGAIEEMVDQIVDTFLTYTASVE